MKLGTINVTPTADAAAPAQPFIIIYSEPVTWLQAAVLFNQYMQAVTKHDAIKHVVALRDYVPDLPLHIATIRASGFRVSQAIRIAFHSSPTIWEQLHNDCADAKESFDSFTVDDIKRTITIGNEAAALSIVRNRPDLVVPRKKNEDGRYSQDSDDKENPDNNLLHLAAAQGLLDLSTYLALRFPELNEVDSNGSFPIDVAKNNEFPDIIAMLKKQFPDARPALTIAVALPSDTKVMPAPPTLTAPLASPAATSPVSHARPSWSTHSTHTAAAESSIKKSRWCCLCRKKPTKIAPKTEVENMTRSQTAPGQRKVI